MSGDSFTLKVLTPAGLVFEDTTAAVSLPSSEGEITILPNHTAYVTVLGIGVIEYSPLQSPQIVRQAVVSGGFCTFKNNELVVLADSVDLPRDRDGRNLSAERETVQRELSNLNGYEEAWTQTRQKLERLDALERIH